MATTLFAQAIPTGVSSGAGNAGTNGLHFTVSATSQLDGIWHYSPSGSTQLPTNIGLYTTTASPATGTLVVSQAATWSGAAGSGWVFAAFTTPPALASGTNYMATQWRNDSANEWFCLYTVTWPVTSGIITAPKDVGGGQGWFDTGTPTAMTFPATQLAGDNFGMDVQVSTPAAGVAAQQPQRQVRGKPARARARLSPSRAAAVPAPASPSRFALPQRLARGKAAARKGRSAASPGSPVVLPGPSPFSILLTEDGFRLLAEDGNPIETEASGPPTSPSPFTPPARPARGGRAARKARLTSAARTATAAAPVTPSPFALPSRITRGRAVLRKARLGQAAGVPVVPSPFTPPAKVTRGRPAARKGRGAGSAGSPVFIPPPVPAPFSPPAKLTRGKAAARKGRQGASAGSPVIPPPPITPSPFTPPQAIRRAHAAVRKARLRHSAGAPVVPTLGSPFTPPAKPVRGRPAARKSRLRRSAGSPVTLSSPAPFSPPAALARGKPAARKGRNRRSAGVPAFVPPAVPAPFSLPALLKRGKAAARRARSSSSAGSPAVLTPIGVGGQWTGARFVASGFFFPSPTAAPLQVDIANTPGDWLFAIVAWRPSPGAGDVSVSVADDAHNWWEPVGNPVTDSDAAGVVRTAVWAAPAARVANSVTGATVVQVAPTGPVLAMAADIVDMFGLKPWYQVAAIDTAVANAATSLSVSSAAPAGRALLFTGFASDDNSKTLTGPSGWNGLTTVSAGNGVDHTADIKLTPAWQVVTGSASASVSASGTLDLAGVIAGVLVSAPQPAQPNPYWPVMTTEVAIGAGVGTAPSEMTWTPLSGQALSLSITQGKQYSLGQLQAGQGTLLLDDPAGALIPPGTGAYAGIDSGTPVRRRVTWPGLPGSPALSPHYVAFSGYIRRWPFNFDADMLRGQVQAELTDAWGYGASPLNAMAIEECLLDSPHSLWPLTDPPGSTGAGNLVTNGPGLDLAVSKFGAGGEVVTWGANSGALIGMSSAQVTSTGAAGGASGMVQTALAGNSLSTVGYGYALTATATDFPPIAGGVTIECFAQLTLGGATGFTVGTGTPATFGSTGSFATGQAVIPSVASGFTFPAGITAGSVYFVIGQGGTSYELSTVPGGGGLAVTVAGAGFFTPTLAWNPVILAARTLGQPVCGLEVDKGTGALSLRYRPAGATADSHVTVDASTDYRSTTFLRHFSLTFSQTSWRVLVDAGGAVTASGTFSSPLPASFNDVSFGGVNDRTSPGLAWPGFLGGPAGVYAGASPQVRVVNRYEAAWLGLHGEAACDRVERLLEYGGLTGRRWLGQQSVQYEGDLMPSGQDVGGQAAASSVNNLTASTAPALASVAPTGDITYLSKLYTWNQPVRWTLGGNTAAGEIPFMPGQLATDYDPSRVTASVQLTQLDSQSVTTPAGIMAATSMTDVAAAAGKQYGGQPYQQTGYLASDWSSAYSAGGSLVDLANWVQAVFAKPQNRVQSVTVNAAAYPAAWPFWAGAAVGDMVQVNVKLPTAGPVPLISLVARITQTARTSQFSPDSASATIAATLDFAPEYQALTCDDPVRGLLDGETNVLPW